MNSYITGSAIRKLREKLGLTQLQLAQRLAVSDKTVSKWETGKGLPDITLVESLAAALNVSVLELMNGEPVTNRNTSGNLLRTRFYVCPICGNVLTGMGDAVISCCGVLLPPLEAEEPDEAHRIRAERVEDELYLTVDHPMTKGHYLSFIAYVTTDQLRIVKLYPEGPAAARLQRTGPGLLYTCCNHHGLTKQRF